jgi:hypothetical protein
VGGVIYVECDVPAGRLRRSSDQPRDLTFGPTRERPMSLTTSPVAQRRIRPISEHAYTLPVVRELPAQPPDPAGVRVLW